MGRASDEVGVPGAHVGGDVRRGLTGVDERERPGGVRGVGHPANVGNRSEHVGHRREREQLRAVEELLEVGEVEQVVRPERDPPKLDVTFSGEDVPWNDVGVMLELGEDDGVTGTDIRPRPGIRDEVDRLRGVAHEHHFVWFVGAEERGHLRARVFERGRGFFRNRVDAAVHVCVGLAVQAIHRVEYLYGLLGRRGGVEIDDPPSVHLSFQDREVRLNAGDVEAHRHAARASRKPSKPSASTRSASSWPPLATMRPLSRT